ncbi:MAG TPA: DEAD/DEAH box helicase [Pirellulaceae bacterium]|nr:DEAD/DEAH box helicase [Pirellulaceae bacterium]
MSIVLAFTPARRVIAVESAAMQGTLLDIGAEREGYRSATKVAKAFARSQAEGLFTLATEKLDTTLPPSIVYWRSFAGRYLTELCHSPQTNGEATATPETTELNTLVLSAPPMQGAEYLSSDALAEVWSDLDAWVRAEGVAFEGGLAAFLRRRAPLWHQVGRVCFHLAENKRDPEYPFAFLATYVPTVTASSRVQHQPLSNALREYSGKRDKKALVNLLSPVHIASQSSEFVRELIESGDIYQPLAWTPPQAYCFLKDVPLLEDSGILVRLPDWWKKRPRPRVNVTIGDARHSSLDAQSMLDFGVQLALGDKTLTEAELRELMAAEDGLVLLRGQWVEVDRERLTEVLEHWKQVEASVGDGLSFAAGMRLLAGAPRDLADGDEPDQQRDWSFVEAGEWLGELLQELRSPEHIQAASPGAALRATLREYQQTGVNWLSFLTSLGLGACLADDMGLGKTIQVLSLLLLKKKRKATNLSLLVLPASLLANWRSEIEKFAPSLRAVFVHPSELSADELTRITRQPKRELQGADVVLTTYGMLLRQAWLLDVQWQIVVLDEAQAIKNAGARQSKLVKRLKADARIALTGTPIENRLSDLWSLFDFLCPGLLGPQQKFKDFVKRLNAREEDNRYAPLRSLVQPYILRRMKTDKQIIADLPDKTEVRAFCGLSKRQAALYAKLVKELAKTLEGSEGMNRRGLVLTYLMRFKQLCNHPSHLTSDGEFDPKQSGKFLRLAEICDEIASRQEKVLVFTQFREMTEPLAEHLASVFGRPGLVLHGGTTVKRRKKLVDQFQSDDGLPFFILSLKAGGTGLNLTAASHVVHFDRWWNPAVENQATDRAFRIGQQRNVLVHKFVCRGTIEERIDGLIEEKTQLSDDLLGVGAEKMLTEMSDKELINLVSLDVERAAV